jgi:hypothetical protein
MEPSKDIVPQGAYPQSTLDEFKTPYSKEFDSVRGYNPIGVFNQPYANFNADWETEFISEEGQGYMRVVETLKKEKKEKDQRLHQHPVKAEKQPELGAQDFKTVVSIIASNFTKGAVRRPYNTLS